MLSQTGFDSERVAVLRQGVGIYFRVSEAGSAAALELVRGDQTRPVMGAFQVVYAEVGKEVVR